MRKIITVGRQFGSGGRELARRLAEELQIDYYDREILAEIAKHTELSEEYVQNVIECKPHHLYPITVGQSISYVNTYAFLQTQSVYTAQRDIIRDLAAKSDCVIVGRCADYILQDLNPYRIFVHADIDSRVARCMERRSAQEAAMTEKEMKKQILRLDKNRAKYYSFYTGQKWGDPACYDLSINTTNCNIKEMAAVIAKLFQ